MRGWVSMRGCVSMRGWVGMRGCVSTWPWEVVQWYPPPAGGSLVGRVGGAEQGSGSRRFP